MKERLSSHLSRLAILPALAALLALAAACSGEQAEVPPTPTPINVSAIIQEAMQAQPQGATADEIAAAVQAQMPDSVTEEQMASAIASALAERPGVTEAQVADAIASALREQTPGLTEADVASAIASALAERPGVTEAQVADAIAAALREQTPGLTEADVADAISKALAERPGVTEEDIERAVESAVAKAAPAQPAPPMMEDLPDLLVRDVFFFATLTPPTGCSFWGCRVSFNMFDGLVALDNAAARLGEQPGLVPNLAESWQISPDGKTYTFEIRPDVTFSTGNDLNADAVRKSIQRAMNVMEREGLAENQAWYTLTDSIEAVSDMTFEWTLTDPYAPLLPLLTSKDLLIVDAEAALANEETDEKGRDYGVKWATERSIGTGPFAVEQFVAEQRLVMERNVDYWGGHDNIHPSVDRVIDVHVPENATAELQIAAGEVDVALQLDPISLQSLEGNEDVEVFTYPSLITCNFLVDRRIPALTDPRGFQAIRHAIDYEGLRDIVALGLADVHQSLILPGMSGHDPAIAMKYAHDPEMARSLLAEAGYPNGFDVQIQLRTGACGSVVYQKGLEFLQNNLKDIGVNAEIVQSTSAKFWGGISEETMRDFGISGLGATYFDSDQPATWRATGECNLLGLDDVAPDISERLAELTAMGRVETDKAARHEIYREMSELMVDNCGEITVLQVRDTVAHRSNISNIVPAAHAFTPEFRYMRKSQ